MKEAKGLPAVSVALLGDSAPPAPPSDNVTTVGFARWLSPSVKTTAKPFVPFEGPAIERVGAGGGGISAPATGPDPTNVPPEPACAAIDEPARSYSANSPFGIVEGGFPRTKVAISDGPRMCDHKPNNA